MRSNIIVIWILDSKPTVLLWCWCCLQKALIITGWWGHVLTTTDGSGGVVYTVLGRKKLFTVQRFFDQSNNSFHFTVFNIWSLHFCICCQIAWAELFQILFPDYSFYFVVYYNWKVSLHLLSKPVWLPPLNHPLRKVCRRKKPHSAKRNEWFGCLK